MKRYCAPTTDPALPKRIKEDDFERPASSLQYLGIEGLSLVDEFITVEEERALIRSIDEEKWDTRLKRRTQHYGFVYDYKSKGASVPAAPLPSWCEFIVERMMDQKIIQVKPDQMIVNEYMPGQGIHPHVDDIRSFDDGIVSLSLGSHVIMDLVHNKNPSIPKREAGLKRRSIISFHGPARYAWRHGITPRRSDHGIDRNRRISLTFRKMKT